MLLFDDNSINHKSYTLIWYFTLLAVCSICKDTELVLHDQVSVTI